MLGEVLSLGQNRRWRKATVDRVVGRRPAVALDVATGTCGVALQVARRTGAYVVGVDLSEAMLSRGRANVAAAGMSSRISLTLGRAERLPFRDCSFDALTYTYLLRYVADPAATLRELARVLKPGGVLAALEFFVPPARPLRAPWWLYTRALLPVAAGLAGGRQWLRVGRFLGPSISSHYARYPLGWTMRAYQLAGLTGVGARPMSLGAGVVLWGTKPDA